MLGVLRCLFLKGVLKLSFFVLVSGGSSWILRAFEMLGTPLVWDFFFFFFFSTYTADLPCPVESGWFLSAFRS